MAERNAFQSNDQSLRNRLSRNGVEYSVPLRFEEEVVGSAVCHPDGSVTCHFNFSGRGMMLRDRLTEGILDHTTVIEDSSRLSSAEAISPKKGA